MLPLRGWSRLGVFPAAGSACASAHTVSGPAIGPSLESLMPSSPRRSRFPGAPNGSPGISSPATHSSYSPLPKQESASAMCQPRQRLDHKHCSRSGIPVASGPRHLPPSRFGYLLDDLLPAAPDEARRLRSIHGVLPSGPCSSRTAVPLSGPRLSCRSPASPEGGTGATTEDCPCVNPATEAVGPAPTALAVGL
jgi:hypothetical protein